MNCLCPACRRPTRIEPHLLDFFTRCDRCGILLRPRRPTAAMPLDPEASIELTAKIVPLGRVREAMANANGQLADLLGAARFVTAEKRVQRESAPAAPQAVMASVPVGEAMSIKAPSRSQPRLIQRALLRQHHHALGILGICGTGLVAILAAGAISLKVRTILHPRSVQAMHVHEAEERRE